MVVHGPENAGPPPSMHHLTWLSADTLEQAPGGIRRPDSPEVLRCAGSGPHLPCMGCKCQAYPQATAPHPVIVSRVHVTDDLHQVLGVNAANPLLGWDKETAEEEC